MADMNLNMLIYPVLMAVFGIIAWVLKEVFERLKTIITEEEVRRLIADKIEPLVNKQDDIKDDLSRLEEKLDQLINLLVGRKMNE